MKYISRHRTEIVRCLQCKCEFDAIIADRKRGWALFCSKACKAVYQEEAKKIVKKLKGL